MSWQDDLALAVNRMVLEQERTRTELATGLAQFHNGNRLTGARAVTVGAGGRELVWAAPGRLVGWSLRATGGPVSLTLRDSRDDTGEPIAVIDLTDGQSQTFWAGPGGISFGEGLRAVSTGAGTLTGSVWLGAVD